MATFTSKPWNGSASKYADTEAYCAACLIDENPSGQPKVQALCKLPYKEPNGDVNTNALSAIASVLAGGRGGVKASPASRAAAMRKLKALQAQAKKS